MGGQDRSGDAEILGGNAGSGGSPPSLATRRTISRLPPSGANSRGRPRKNIRCFRYGDFGIHQTSAELRLFLRLFVEAAPHQHSRDSAPKQNVLSGEIHDSDHSTARIAETIFGSTVSDGARLLRICRGCQNNDANVTVGGGKCVSIDVDKIECVDLSD